MLIDGSNPTYYPSFHEAIIAAVDGDVIQSNAVVISESSTYNRDISIKLEGGYDCNYSTIIGDTTLNGGNRFLMSLSLIEGRKYHYYDIMLSIQ